MSKHNTNCAGIDTGKRQLDVALVDSPDLLRVTNAAESFGGLSAWLRRHGVKRVGIEASGGYEQAVVRWLRSDGFVVVVFQPGQVRAYAKFHLKRAKNDKIDAALIALCTAAIKTIHAPPDPRLASMAGHQTLIDQIIDEISRLKNYRESCRDPAMRQFWEAEIKRFRGLFRNELKQLVTAIRQHHDLAERLDLIVSIDGIAVRTATAILVRFPEIGRVSREQAAALAGLAPYDDDSGERRGARHIAGGRKRLRGSLYAASLAASMRWNAELVELYDRLRAAGKEHKVALTACARKLLIFANAVVARGTPWVSHAHATH
jgi:transposase